MRFCGFASWRGAAGGTPRIRFAARLGAAAILGGLILGLGACSPIAAWRHLNGLDRNDPDPATTANTKNLAAGENGPYPNLATVPPPPSTAMTEVERKNLATGLIADRTHARYTNEALKPGYPAGADVPPPPPPLPPDLAAAVKNPAAPPAADTKLASAQPLTDANGKPVSGRRKPGEPPAPGPMESSLQTPEIAETPIPGQPRPPPAVPPVAPEAAAPASRMPSPAALASAQPEAAPDEPSLSGLEDAPPAPPRAAAKAEKSAGKQAPPKKQEITVATIGFPGPVASLGPGTGPVIDKIAQFYKIKPGTVRIIGYTGPVGDTPLAQLNRFSAALDRAQAVASALSKAGIPQNKIHVEAAPEGADLGASHAEIQFIYQ